MFENELKNEKKAIAAGLCTGDTRLFAERMKELKGLIAACGMTCVDELTQTLDHEEGAQLIGSGKVAELKALAAMREADCVVFLNALTPAQLANLAHDLETEVLDKTGLILNIFRERARTAEAKMQVEYAQLSYMLPRLVGLRQNLSRQGGTGGSMSNKGSGEKQIELDRRHIEKRMSELKKGLSQIESGRETQRKKRRREGVPLAALCGYTNAGKSTLMNSLLRAQSAEPEKQVMEKDMLFATLDTTVRRITPENHRDFLLSDTVGFIDDLPHSLVQAFHSTLSEIRLADLIIQVVDDSDEQRQRHMAVTEETLRELGAGHIPMLYVMNKADRVPEERNLPRVQGNRIYMSAKLGIGLSELTELIVTALYGKAVEKELLIPYSDGAAENNLRQMAEVLSCDYTEEGVRMRVRLGEKTLEKQGLLQYVIA